MRALTLAWSWLPSLASSTYRTNVSPGHSISIKFLFVMLQYRKLALRSFTSHGCLPNESPLTLTGFAVLRQRREHDKDTKSFSSGYCHSNASTPAPGAGYVSVTKARLKSSRNTGYTAKTPFDNATGIDFWRLR